MHNQIKLYTVIITETTLLLFMVEAKQIQSYNRLIPHAVVCPLMDRAVKDHS